MRLLTHRTLPRTTTLAVVVAACASGGGGAGRPAAPEGAAAAPPSVAAAQAALVGTRCAGGTACRCRVPRTDDAEAEPPPAGMKRFEIRMAVEGGGARLDAPLLGHFEAGPDEACFYVDVAGGADTDVVFQAAALRPDAGLAPRLAVAEYGPKGPFWYDTLRIDCGGAGVRCERQAAEDLIGAARTWKRGRVDPCGSAVVSRMAWETSGGQGQRDGGLFRDLTVTFHLEVKKFETRFAPRATECVPK